MKFSIILLCVALALIAFVDATAVDLRKRNAQRGGNRQCTSKTIKAPSKAQSQTTPPAAASSKTLANSGKVGQGGQQGGQQGKGKGGAAASSSVAAVNKGVDTTSAAAAATDTATATQNGGNKGGAANDNNGGSVTCLAAGALQTGSENTGQSGNITAGQVASQTDDANFINVCDGQTLTNGLQVVTGSCNGVPLGFIPAKTKMPSSLITFPQHNQDIAADTTFTINILNTNIDLGHFTNAQLTYYSAPTQLNAQGEVIGHTHITCQDLGGSFTPSAPLDASTFAFFLGINTPANAQGQVSATVPNGLPAGFYRCCTMVANANHSPLQMPVAQRGAQDDCRYFSTGQTAGDAGNGGAAAQQANTAAGTATTAAAAATSSAAAAQKGGQKAGGKTGGKNGRGRARARI